MDILQLIQANLLTPIILFFLFGIIAARIKSDLKIPNAISEFLPIYLLAAIGLHGGIEMRNTGFENMLIPMFVAIGLSLLFTFCLLYTSPSPRDRSLSRMPSSA